MIQKYELKLCTLLIYPPTQKWIWQQQKFEYTHKWNLILIKLSYFNFLETLHVYLTSWENLDEMRWNNTWKFLFSLHKFWVASFCRNIYDITLIDFSFFHFYLVHWIDHITRKQSYTYLIGTNKCPSTHSNTIVATPEKLNGF